MPLAEICPTARAIARAALGRLGARLGRTGPCAPPRRWRNWTCAAPKGRARLRAHADVDPVERIGQARSSSMIDIFSRSASASDRARWDIASRPFASSRQSGRASSLARNQAPLSRWGRRSFPCIAADLAAARRYIGDRKLPLGEQADQTGRKRRAPNLISRYSRGDRVRKRRASRSERPERERPSCA